MTEIDQKQLGGTLSGIANQSGGRRFDLRQFFGAAHNSRQAIDDYLASAREGWELMNDRIDTEYEVQMMEAIRTIQTVENGEVHLRLPEQFWGQEVEIIVLSVPEEGPQRVATRRSLRGCLKQYAKPALIAQEQHARQTAASEKHEPR